MTPTDCAALARKDPRPDCQKYVTLESSDANTCATSACNCCQDGPASMMSSSYYIWQTQEKAAGSGATCTGYDYDSSS
jgi:hypothetical protein